MSHTPYKRLVSTLLRPPLLLTACSSHQITKPTAHQIFHTYYIPVTGSMSASIHGEAIDASSECIPELYDPENPIEEPITYPAVQP